MRWGLIGVCLAVLAVLIFAPLIAVFAEALRDGWAFALASLGDRAMGEFGAVAVVSGMIRGQTTAMPLMIEKFCNEYLSVAAFTMAGLLALLALAMLTLTLKSALEWRYADQLAATDRH